MKNFIFPILLGLVLSSTGFAVDKPLLSKKTRKPAAEEPSSTVWQEKFPLSQLRIKWTDQLGTSINSPIQVKTDTTWKREGRFERPFLKFTFTIPNKQVWEVTTPHIETIKKDQELVAILDPFAGKIDFKAINEKGQTQTYSITLMAKSKEGIYVVHPSCAEKNIQLETIQETEIEFLWTSAYCQDRGDSLEISFYKPRNKSDLKIESTNSLEVPFSTPGWNTFKYKKDSREKDTDTLGYVTYRNIGSSKSQNKISYKPSSTRRENFGLFPGIGVTYVSYKEPRQNIELTQMSLTARVNGFIRLKPQWLRLEGDSQIDAAPFNISSGAPAAARMMSGGIRLGIQPTTSMAKLKWTLLGGSYITKMLVPDDVFGLQMMSGAQIVLRANSDPKYTSKVFYFQVGYNTIADENAILNLSNGGINFSAGYQLLIWKGHPMDLTFHFSSTNYLSSDLLNEMHMMSTYLGTQIGF